jgi:hypothetical protein
MVTGMPWMPTWRVMMPRAARLGEAAVRANAGAGKLMEGGVFAGGFGFAEDAVEAGGGGAGADVLEIDVIAVGGGVAVFGQEGELGVDGEFGEGGFVGGPELVEVGGVGLGGLDAFGLEGGGGEGTVGLPFFSTVSDAAEKAGLGAGRRPFDGVGLRRGGERSRRFAGGGSVSASMR